MVQFLENPFFIIQIFSCFFLTGLIWTIQLVHYPSFAYLEKNTFTEFHLFHSNRITLIVGPLMLAELISAYFLYSKLDWSLNLGSVILIWLITAFISIPLHNKLRRQQNQDVIKSLVTTNWLRTILWTARSLFFCFILLK